LLVAFAVAPVAYSDLYHDKPQPEQRETSRRERS
jgi:hypothetical protein